MEPLVGMVTSKGQLVIPVKLRRAYRIEPGTRVRFQGIRGGIAIYPKYEEAIQHYRGILAGLGLPEDIGRDPDRAIE
jgi:AbrB family looped-hinge helix DNA binding protein